MEYLELLGKIEQWAKDRGLDTVEARTQYTKLTEEQGELAQAIVDNNIDGDSGVKDSLGDYQVTLIIYCLIRNLGLKERIKKQGEFWKVNDDLDEYESTAETMRKLKFMELVSASSSVINCYNKNKDELEELLNACEVLRQLHSIAKYYNTSLEETLEVAYNEIKDRKGKMIDGVFVKEADLNG